MILGLREIEARQIRRWRDPEGRRCVHVRLLHRPEPVRGATPVAEGIRAVGMALRRDHVAEDTMIEVEGAGEVEKGREVAVRNRSKQGGVNHEQIASDISHAR